MIERQKDATERVVMMLVAFPNESVASQIGTELVRSQQAACVNLIPGVQSIYHWEEKLERESECLALIKTSTSRLEGLESWIHERHPYKEPEILVIPVEAGSAGYLGWVRSQVEE